MNPGLHELACKNCGAPVNPPASSTVVTCAHCGQAHMWIAPGPNAQGQWVVQRMPVRRGNGAKWLVLAGAAALVLVVAMGAVGALVLMRSKPTPGANESVAPDAPLAVGDTVEWHRTQNDSCQAYVGALLAAGNVLVLCGDDGVPTVRASLTFDTYAFHAPEPEDVALERSPTGWSRVIVTGLAGGTRVRVEPLLGGAEQDVDSSALRPVWQRSSAMVWRWVPVPAALALQPGDVLQYHDAGVIRSGKVTDGPADDVALVPGVIVNGVFAPDNTLPPARRARSAVMLELASPLSPPAPAVTLVAEHNGKWLRASLLGTGDHGRWTLRAADGAEQWVAWGGQVLLLLHA